jgi:hypothetical protein
MTEDTRDEDPLRETRRAVIEDLVAMFIAIKQRTVRLSWELWIAQYPQHGPVWHAAQIADALGLPLNDVTEILNDFSSAIETLETARWRLPS